MSHVDQGPLPGYNSLTDNNLNGYFASTRMRSHLRRAGLITKHGEIVSENTYRLNMSRKEHKKHVKDMLSQAIVHKTLDLERSRQSEIRKKLEEIAKIELVRRVRSSRDRKRENCVLPLVSPRRDSSCQSSITSASSAQPTTMRRRPIKSAGGSPTRKGKRPISALSSNYDDENETVVYLDDEGRPISPAHIDRSEMKYSSKDPIDTRHLYSLDTAALRKYAMLMAKMEQGRGGLASPYLIPQIPLPPKSPRSGRAPLSAHRQRSDSDRKYTSPKRPATASQAYLHPAGGPRQVRGQQETMCEVFMEYHGSSLSLVREQFDKRQDVIVEQQHCGGNTLTVFRDKMEAGTKFSFISYRHRGYPFSLSLYIDGKINCRVSVCCEDRHSKGGRIGGKKGHFSICSITGAIPCYKCQVEKGIRVKSSAPRRKLKRPPQTMEEVTVVETQKDKCEEDDKTEAIKEQTGEEILVPVDDDDDKNAGQSKSEGAEDNYSEEFEESESEEEGFLNFQPKDARGVDKTIGRVDINDSNTSSSSDSNSHSEDQDDLRAKTPTPHGRKKKMKKKKGQPRNKSGSSSSSTISSDTAKEDSDDDNKEMKAKGDKDADANDIEKLQTEVMARFFCAQPISKTRVSSDGEEDDSKKTVTITKEEDGGKEEKKADETSAAETGGERRVSLSSTSSDSSSSESSDDGKRKTKGSTEDYSDSRKEEDKDRKTSVPKIVDMGMEDDAHAQDKLVMESESSVTVLQVGATPLMEVKNSKLENPEETKHDVNYAKEQSDYFGKWEETTKDKDDASSSSSSPSSSSSSGSATLHDKGPNTVNDPTLTLDDQCREENGHVSKAGDDSEKAKEQEEEIKEKPKVEIIREDLAKKPVSDSGSSSDSSSSGSESEDEKTDTKKATTWQAKADVHQSESQPESDPEATHGGNDPDNVADGNGDVNGSRSFEPAVPIKAKPGSILPLLEASQTTLEIKGVTLNKSQVYEVAEFLEKKSGINSINLVNCGIDDDDIQKLMEAIQQSPSNPMMLNLGLNPLTVECVHHILTACKHKPTIEAVLLQGTRLGDDGVNALIAGMMAQLEDKKMRGQPLDKGIHELDLSDCKFGDQGALGVARLLTSRLDIDTLTLTHNHAISPDGWRAIGDALKLNSNLETLTLDHNYIGDEGMEHITHGLFDNTSVTAIDINDVNITDKGGKFVMELLKRNTYLLEITVIENKLSDELSENIQKYLSLNKASFSPK